MLRSILYQQIRTKTYVKTPTKAYLKKLAMNKYSKLMNNEVVIPSNLQETKFFKVIGPMKVYKPITNGVKNKRVPTRFHLHKGKCIQRLSIGKRSSGGRNHTGKITVRSRGGGHKKRIRLLEKPVQGSYRVERIEYDPNRTNELFLLRHLSLNEFYYVLRTEGVEVGQVVHYFPKGLDTTLTKSEILKDGNLLPLMNIPIGSHIHNISLRPDGVGKMCRAAGSYAQLLSVNDIHAQLKLTSGEIRLVDKECPAVLGKSANAVLKLRKLGKAGVRRHMGRRPSVRGFFKLTRSCNESE